MKKTKRQQKTHQSYYEEDSANSGLPEHTVITPLQAQNIIFKILDEPNPSEQQLRSSKMLIQLAVRQNKFHSLIYDLSALKGCYDEFCDKFYIVKTSTRTKRIPS